MILHYKAGDPILLTYEDYCALPDDGKRYEILEGSLHVIPSPQTKHQAVLLNLAEVIRQYCRPRRLGRVFVAPYDIVLERHTVVQPDIVFVAAARRAIITRTNIQGVPDLVVEILSPSNRQFDQVDKLHLYAKFAAPHYWIVDPDEERITELTEPREGAYFSVREVVAGDAFEPKLFPELRIDVSATFSEAD